MRMQRPSPAQTLRPAASMIYTERMAEGLCSPRPPNSPHPVHSADESMHEGRISTEENASTNAPVVGRAGKDHARVFSFRFSWQKIKEENEIKDEIQKKGRSRGIKLQKRKEKEKGGKSLSHAKKKGKSESPCSTAHEGLKRPHKHPTS